MGLQYTSDGIRPALADIPVNDPHGYIGQRIYPNLTRTKKSGTLYYGTLTADAAAQEDRSLGTAPVCTNLAASNTTFTCTEITKRYGVPASTVDELGGIEAADMKGAKGAKRSVMRGIEDDIAAATLKGSHSANDVGTDIMGAFRAAKNSVKRYAGDLVAVMSETAFWQILEDDDVVTRLNRYNSVTPADNSQILGLKKTLLAMVLEIDEILIGDDDHWAATVDGTDLSTRAAIVKAPPAGFDEIMEMDPIYGCAVQYEPEDGRDISIESYADRDDKNNKYTATTWRNLKTLNSGALYLLSGIDTSIGT